MWSNLSFDVYTYILKKYDDWCLKLFATVNFYILLNIGFGKWSLQLHIHTTTHTYNFTQWKRPLDVGHMQLMNSKAFLILTFEKLWHKEILSSAYCLFHSSKGTYFFFDSQKASYKSFKFNWDNLALDLFLWHMAFTIFFLLIDCTLLIKKDWTMKKWFCV